TDPEQYRDTAIYPYIAKIYSTLQRCRGFDSFVRSPNLPNCDFYVPFPGFLVEFDESQHFTKCRNLTFSSYPETLQIGFNRQKWMELCDAIAARDNDPPFRDEQRAWYDTLRDFVPSIKGMLPTIRLYASEFRWCDLSPH